MARRPDLRGDKRSPRTPPRNGKPKAKRARPLLAITLRGVGYWAAVIVIWLIARFAGKKELAIIKEQLALEVAGGVLTPREFQVLTSNALRRQAVREAARYAGRDGKRRQRRFFQAAAELAFRKYHLSGGERPGRGQDSPEDTYRAELAMLRTQLAGRPAM